MKKRIVLLSLLVVCSIGMAQAKRLESASQIDAKIKNKVAKEKEQLTADKSDRLLKRFEKIKSRRKDNYLFSSEVTLQKIQEIFESAAQGETNDGLRLIASDAKSHSLGKLGQSKRQGEITIALWDKAESKVIEACRAKAFEAINDEGLALLVTAERTKKHRSIYRPKQLVRYLVKKAVKEKRQEIFKKYQAKRKELVAQGDWKERKIRAKWFFSRQKELKSLKKERRKMAKKFRRANKGKTVIRHHVRLNIEKHRVDCQLVKK